MNQGSSGSGLGRGKQLYMTVQPNGGGNQLRQQPELDEEDNDSSSNEDNNEVEPNRVMYNQHPKAGGGKGFELTGGKQLFYVVF
eukprot:8943468-Ditylum_brightwellii.AAC.1